MTDWVFGNNSMNPYNNYGRSVDPYKNGGMSDEQIKQLQGMEQNRTATQKQMLGEAQNYQDYLMSVMQRMGQQSAMQGLDIQRLLAGMNPNYYQAGPIVHATVNPGGLFSGTRGPVQITGDYSPAKKWEMAQREAKFDDWINQLLGLITGQSKDGQSSGADFDSIYRSMASDMEANAAKERTRLAEKFAGLGRSVTSSAALDAQNQIGDALSRALLGARAETEKLRITDNAARQNQASSALGPLLSLIASFQKTM